MQPAEPVPFLHSVGSDSALNQAGETSMRETLLQCPHCLARYMALLWEEAPPIAFRCIECDAPMPEKVDGEFVFAILQPPAVH
jgi:hypothetical protein